MSKSEESFGRKAARAESLSDLLDLEVSEHRSERFIALDSLIGGLLSSILRGERLLAPVQRKKGESIIEIFGLTSDQREYVEETFHLERLRARGAWFAPESANLKLGMLTLPVCFKEYGRFGSGIAREDNGNFSFKDSPDLVLLWAVLEPLLTTLFLPFEIRGYQAGAKSQEDQLKSWSEVESILSALGFSVAEELSVMRYGGGWHRLRAFAQFEAKQRLLRALADQVNREMAVRYRAYRVRGLVDQYYKKAKSAGTAKRKQVVTKQLERTVVGYFGGDWLAVLDYLGEQPHPEEEIVTALPQTRLHVGGSSRAEEIAARQGVSAEEVKRIAAAYWQQPVSQSPVERRVELFKRYWEPFDEIHARQAPGMKSLWGLVKEDRFLNLGYRIDHFHPDLYRELMPGQVVSEIEDLWGTLVLTRWPDRIVSEPFPHALMAETLGPALKFWHGCALTAWFLCEGPYSRTDMTGLAEYYRREIAALEGVGTPVEPSLFAELIEGEASLGEPVPLKEDESTVEVVEGLSFTITMSTGSRRPGFEKLRDIITRHRRAWAEQYYSKYLRARWESEIKEAERAYNLLVNQKGKAPTLKQFASQAVTATNHWFGGDVSGLYGAIREKSPVQPRYDPLMPADRLEFARRVFYAIGGKRAPEKNVTEGQVERQDTGLERLAELSFWYVQLEEALGRAPTLKEFGANKLDYYGRSLSENPDEAWTIYSQAIEAAKTGLPVTRRESS
jgi:hypothetical protein